MGQSMTISKYRPPKGEESKFTISNYFHYSL